VQGVRVNNQVIPADYVGCNADFPYAMTELIKDKAARGKYTPKKIENMDYSCSCLVFYWGVDMKVDSLQTHNFIVSPDLDDNLTKIFDGRLLDDPSMYLHVPSQVDPEMAPEGKSSFYLLIPVSELKTGQYEWNEETLDYYRTKAFSTLKKMNGLEDFDTKIEVEHIFTPHDFKNRFNAHYGATFGLQPTLKQSNHWRPQSKSLSCEGLYFTGSSTHPGAGVPIVIQSGKICASELMKDDVN
ncbi:MAG: dehydrosqualene desaturase, partial [Erysipelothrix sp.]|nr:dehydrosqualene desaturase [Erysipelothrix sp.]